MKKATKQYITCGFLLVAGLGLCIGGIFLPPLLIAGVPIFTGGLAILAALIEDNDKIAINTTINNFRRDRDGNDYVESATVHARYSASPSSKLKIGSFATKIRDMFNRVPSDFKTAEPTIISFSNNYHTAMDSSEHASQDMQARFSSESISDESSNCGSDDSKESHHLDPT